MSSPIVIPFNFDPIQISVVTTSFTVPAGRYARVIANVEGSATFTINGATALRGTQNSVLTSSVMRTDGSGFLAAGPTTGIQNAYGFGVDQKPLVHDFFLPTGTIINGSGSWRAVVEQYNKIT